MFSIATTTNYYEFGSVKQHPLSRSPACGPEVWYNMAGSSAQGVTRLRSRCQPDEIIFWVLPGEIPTSASELILVISRIEFPVVLRLKSLFSGWLSVRDCS